MENHTDKHECVIENNNKQESGYDSAEEVDMIEVEDTSVVEVEVCSIGFGVQGWHKDRLDELVVAYFGG